MAKFPQVEITDVNGQVVLRYLKLDDDHYFGGVTHSQFLDQLPFAYGPHVQLNLFGLLDLLVKIEGIHVKPHCQYWVRGGNGSYASQVIEREMRSSALATIFDVPEQAIRDHYDHVVLVPEKKKKKGCSCG